MTYNVFSGMLNLTQSINQSLHFDEIQYVAEHINWPLTCEQCIMRESLFLLWYGFTRLMQRIFNF